MIFIYCTNKFTGFYAGGRVFIYNMAQELRIVRLTETSQLPKAGSQFAAGLDLYADVDADVIIPFHGKALIPLNISMIIPEGYYGRLAPRSSLAWKHHIDVGAGVIDSE